MGARAAAGLRPKAQGEGETSKAALIAVARELLRIANAVIRDGRAWDPKMAAAA
jgi:hypothetical protein